MERRETIGLHLKNLQTEISCLLNVESQHQEDIKALETDVQAYKSAFISSEQSRRNAEHKLQELEKEFNKVKLDFENQVMTLKGSERRVICLVDGDGAIFSPDLLSQGQDGGHAAAKMISESVRQEFLTRFQLDVDQMRLWVHVFYNKFGLMEAIGQAGHWAAKHKFEDFALGFNRAAERFVMVDVGPGKEAADAKIKVILEDNVRLPQTCKILFGGCHDNGYVASLRSVITAGFKDKLVLLRSYKVSAAGIDMLGLPSMTIPQLFIQDKFVTSPSGAPAGQALDPLSVAADNAMNISSPMSYKSVLRAGQQGQNQAAISELDAPGSASSNTSDEPINHRASPSKRLRRVNRHIPLSKHNPPPCTLFYLASCKHGTDCKYGHDYILEDDHYETIRENARKGPCPAINRNEVCPWGETCCYGHVCHLGSKCHYRVIGKCKFVGAGMHKDTSAASA